MDTDKMIDKLKDVGFTKETKEAVMEDDIARNHTLNMIKTNLDLLTVNELNQVVLRANNLIQTKTYGHTLSSTDKEVLKHVPSRIHRAKYLKDKYTYLNLSECLAIVDRFVVATKPEFDIDEYDRAVNPSRD